MSSGRDLGEARRLELGLIGLRWFVVALGVLRTVVTLSSRPQAPDYVVPVGFVLVGMLAIGNVIVSVRAEQARRVEQLARVGLVAFLLDIAVVTGLVWTSSDSPSDPTWVLAYLLPLEGAIRYRLAGALWPVGVAVVSETLRELSQTERLSGHRFDVAALAFRVGIELVVAVVAGLMARSLQREADKARQRAWLAEEAARLAEEAARREAAARKEVAAFHTATLAGVAATDVHEGLRSMAEAIGRDLDFEAFAILLLEDDRLVARGVYGEPGYPTGKSFELGEGVIGRAAGTARPVEGHTDGRDGSDAAWAEAAVPLRVGSELIGVLHKRVAKAAIEPERLRLLSSLADQIALVVQAARLRARQEETLRRLRELDEMKSDFVAITSHELRTPLAAIRGFVNTLIRRLNELSPDDVREFLGIVDQQTERLTRLVEDLLVVSRIEAGKITFNVEAVATSTFLVVLVQGFGDAAPRIELEVAPDLPERVMTDPHRLGQVLTNLIHNAIKFSPPAEPVRLFAGASDLGVLFAVMDSGVGIPNEELSRIFERFHQTDAASTRKAEGAGLGLYITKRLVEAMGGRIEVESEVGVGSTFRVSLPLGLPPVAPARPSAAARVD